MKQSRWRAHVLFFYRGGVIVDPLSRVDHFYYSLSSLFCGTIRLSFYLSWSWRRLLTEKAAQTSTATMAAAAA